MKSPCLWLLSLVPAILVGCQSTGSNCCSPCQNTCQQACPQKCETKCQRVCPPKCDPKPVCCPAPKQQCCTKPVETIVIKKPCPCESAPKCQTCSTPKATCNNCCPQLFSGLKRAWGSMNKGGCNSCTKTCGNPCPNTCCPCQNTKPACCPPPAPVSLPTKTACLPCEAQKRIVHSYVQGPTNEQASLPVAVKVPVATATNFYHNDDYTRIVGVLFLDEATNAWKIRFADANQSDELGGVVTLAGTRSGPSQLKAGMVVSVQGKLFSKPTADGSTEYLADDVSVLTP